MKKEIFIVKAGSGTTDQDDIFMSSKIEFAATSDFETVREFYLKGLLPTEAEFEAIRVEQFLKNERAYLHLAYERKFVVRCKVQSNEMLQMYEIVKTIKEGN